MIPKQNSSIGHEPHRFPRLEVIILVLCVTVNWYTLVNLFSYVGIMIKQLLELESINESGFYAGYVASAFMFGRFLSGYAIGHLSDNVGRKPVLIFSLLSVMIFSLAFGLSESFPWAIGSRLLLGMTDGIISTARTSLRELCGREHVVMGMVYVSGAWPIGLVIGTGIGGLLATPAIHYPTVFAPTGLFGRYPFLLPNLLGSLFAAVALPLVIFWYPETKDLDKRRGDGEFTRLVTEATADGQNEVTSGGSFSANSNSAGDERDTSITGDIEQGEIRFCEWNDGKQNWIILKLLFFGCIVPMMVVGFDEVFPLWMLSTPEVGGLGWNTEEIGELALATGILMGIIQFTVLPHIVRLIGIVRWYRTAWVLTVVAFVLIPNAKTLSWNSPSLFAVGVMGSLLFDCCSSGILIALAIASTNISAPQHRGKLSGLYNTAENLGRFFGPFGFSTIYALSISRSTREGDGAGVSWLDHHFVFYASAIVLALLAGIGWPTLTSEIVDKPVPEETG